MKGISGRDVPGSLYELCWAHSRDAVFVAEFETGALIDLNPAAEALIGWQCEELMGRHFSEIHPADEQASIREVFGKGQTPHVVPRGFHLACRDSRIIPVEIRSSGPFELDGRRMLVVVHRDTSEFADQEHRLAVQRWALSAYGGVALALARARSSEGLVQGVCEAITQETSSGLAGVGFAGDGPGKPIRVIGAAGTGSSYMDGLELSWSEESPAGRGPSGEAIRSGQVQVMEDSEARENFRHWRERARLAGIRSSVTIPFVSEGVGRGALMVYARHARAFEPVAIDVFRHLAEEVGIGLSALRRREILDEERQERERAQEELAQALTAVVIAMARAMEVRDPYTAGHENRVAEVACAIAQELGWTEERIRGLRMASLLHDMGKISVPTEILNKPVTLSHAEFSLIKEHPETGYAILRDLPFPWPLADIVRQHHERLEGSGYPLGLKGEAILPEARVLAVADVLESMSSPPPYRPARGMEVALAEIEEQAGTKLDADAVRVCVSIFREGRFYGAGMWHDSESGTPQRTAD